MLTEARISFLLLVVMGRVIGFVLQ